MEIALLIANQMSFLSVADAFLARRRWTSPPHQGTGRQPKWRPRLISLSTVACFVWHPRGVQIWYGIYSRLWLLRSIWIANWTLPEDLQSMCCEQEGPVWMLCCWAGWCRSQRDWSGGGYSPEWVHHSSSTQPFNVQSVSKPTKTPTHFLLVQECLLELHYISAAEKSWQSWCSCERGTAGWHQSRGCGWVFWCARGALNKHSFERSPLYEFLLQPSPRVDFHLVLNTCLLFSSIQYSDF